MINRNKSNDRSAVVVQMRAARNRIKVILLLIAVAIAFLGYKLLS